MFFGFYSVISTSRGDLHLAVWLIFAAAIMDTLDGKIARWANASSDFGVEYDSLADVVSFGFAPSYLVYTSYFHNWGNVGMFVSFAPLLFGSIRLARFNVQLEGFDKTHFVGLPIPAAALTISSFLFFEKNFLKAGNHPKLFLFVVLSASLLMISNIRYEVFPKLKYDGTRSQFLKVTAIYAGILSLFIYPTKVLFILCALYVLSGIANAIKRNIAYLSKNNRTQKKYSHKKKNRGKDESNRKSSTEKGDS
jgi:CDP-diacylglycerol--serine O-phosphatidyltransferase